MVNRRIASRQRNYDIGEDRDLQTSAEGLYDFYKDDDDCVVFRCAPYLLDDTIVIHYAVLRGVKDILVGKVMQLKQQFNLPKERSSTSDGFTYEARKAILGEIHEKSKVYYQPVHTKNDMLAFIEDHQFSFKMVSPNQSMEIPNAICGFTVATQHVYADSMLECLDIMMDMVAEQENE